MCPVSMSTAPMSQPEDLWSLLFQKLHLSEDVAGATFMAAGSSTPELFASVIGKKPYQPRTHDLERAQAWCPDLRRRLSALSLHVLISEMGESERQEVRSWFPGAEPRRGGVGERTGVAFLPGDDGSVLKFRLWRQLHNSVTIPQNTELVLSTGVICGT